MDVRMRDPIVHRVDDLLERIEHATVATVSADGMPWNTPVFFARRGLSLYWSSRRDAQHSLNIEHNGRGFIVVFDSGRQDASGAGVYIEAAVHQLTDEIAICDAAQLIYSRRRVPVPSARHFAPGSVHAVYHARALKVWSNVLHTSGEIPWDERVEFHVDGR